MARLRSLLKISAVLLLSLGVLAGAVYTLWLDHQIRQRFAGARWALPAQIYAAPLEIYPGMPLTRHQMRVELERLGYQPLADNGWRQGRYRFARDAIEISTRPFHFPEGEQDSQRLLLRYSGESLVALQGADGKGLALAQLDPLLIGSIYPSHGEDRVLVKLEEVPELLHQGLVQTEDQRFYQHLGLDPRAIARAFVANIKAGRVVQGGSTLTQQLIKNFFLHNQRVFSRKATEAVMALLLELHYDKPEILEAYLNEVYLGQDGERAIHGFGLGSEFYFRKPLAELGADELATLVGMVKGPSYYNPRRHPERARSRRDLVLRQWYEAGLIDDAGLAQATARPVVASDPTSQGQVRYPAFVQQVHRELARDYPQDTLTREGLRIFTTLDPQVQDAAERAIREGLSSIEADRRLSRLEAAAVVASVSDGSIKALVGGRDGQARGFNRALDARRPVGSTLKPVVYLAALQQSQRYQLTTLLRDEPVTLAMPNGSVWSPENFDQQTHGPVPLFEALSQSYNLATVNLGLELGLDQVVETLRDLGVEEYVPALPSLLLGAWDRSPLQLAQLYAALASGGYTRQLVSIRAVQTADGAELKRYPMALAEPLPAAPVAQLNWALQSATQQGTGRGIYRHLSADIAVAGKTGTSDELRDSWFAGYGENLLGIVWVGHDDNSPSQLTGASGALPIWARMMASSGLSGLTEPLVPDLEWQRIDTESWLPAPRGCQRVLRIPFVAGTVPDDKAPCAEQTLRDRFREWWQ